MSHGSEGRDGQAGGRTPALEGAEQSPERPGPSAVPEAVAGRPGGGAANRARTWIPLIWPLLTSVIVLGLLQPRLLLTDTTPALGDFAGHVFPFGELVDRVTRGQGILGWSSGWFGGFPLFYFYFPLPGLMVVLLAPLLGFNVALKLVGVTGLLCLPFAAYFLVRSMGVGRATAGVASAAGGSLVLMTSYELFGGNALSTLRASRHGGRWWIGASLLLAATATSHLIPTLAALAATAPLLVRGGGRRGLLAGVGVGFLVSGFWSVPFLAYQAEMATLPWSFERSLAEVIPGELAWLLLPAVVGGVAVVRSRWYMGPLATAMALGLVAYMAPEGAFMRARLLPYWYLGVHLLAGLGLGTTALWWMRDRSHLALVTAAAALGCFSLQNVLRDPAPIVRWAVQNHEGMQARDAWPDYRALLSRLDDLPPGRIHWEDSDVISRFGSPYAMTALPHWRPDHPVVGGLWAESSRVTPFHLRLRAETATRVHTRTYLELPGIEMDLARGTEHMRVLGARYLLTFTEGVAAAARAEPGLREVGSGDAWTLFDAGAVPVVEVVGVTPTPVSPDAFTAAALAWWDGETGGPWPVEVEGAEWRQEPPSQPDRASTVELLRLTDERLAFRTTAVGEPHLVRVPYFPRWGASGALGPYRAGPSLMVVVPTANEVQLTFRPGLAERLGMAASLVGLLWVAGAWLRATRSPLAGTRDA